MARIALLTPPFVQPNTWYPATSFLSGFLKGRGVDANQYDLSLEVLLHLLSPAGIAEVEKTSGLSLEQYRTVIPLVVEFLQKPHPGLAYRLLQPGFLPEGPRFQILTDLPDGPAGEFGRMGLTDRARHLASLVVDDLVDLVRERVDPHFGFSRYAESLAASQKSFEQIRAAVTKPGLMRTWITEATDRLLGAGPYDIIGFTVPFPGNLVGALIAAEHCKRRWPNAKLVMGGGYVNTELRELAEPGLFDFVDYVTLDSGEEPLLAIIERLSSPTAQLERTFVRVGGVVAYSGSHKPPLKQNEAGLPSTTGLMPERYLSMLEMLNPAHRLWSEGPWNKLVGAHGCYWKKCAFCDTSLDYISRFDPSSAEILIARMESLIAENGIRGFHFVDEAFPPALARRLSEAILKRGLQVHWWGNIRFDAAFTPELTNLMARAGCIAVTGGLEVASDRLLSAMNKGVTVKQVTAVTRAFKQSGILVHAYLMYGFPSQTESEILSALDTVRNLFLKGCLDSVHWHRFSTTAHSPVGRDPKHYGIVLAPETPGFARNDLAFNHTNGVDYDRYSAGLKAAAYNFMHGIGFDRQAREWFPKIRDKDSRGRGVGSQVQKKSRGSRPARSRKASG